MASLFPASVDTFSTPTAGSATSSPSHATLHVNVNNAITNAQTYMGMTLISSTTIGTTVSSTTVSSCFSSTYTNFKIVGAGISTTANGGVLYLKINNSTGSTYFGNMIYNVPTVSAIAGVSAANGTSNGFFVATTSSSGTISFEATIDSPFLAVTSNCFGNYAGRAYNGQASGHDSNAASSTGFILAPSSGTMTGGTIRVYGYRQ